MFSCTLRRIKILKIKKYIHFPKLKMRKLKLTTISLHKTILYIVTKRFIFWEYKEKRNGHPHYQMVLKRNSFFEYRNTHTEKAPVDKLSPLATGILYFTAEVGI